MNQWDCRVPPTVLQAGILTFILTLPNREKTSIEKPLMWKKFRRLVARTGIESKSFTRNNFGKLRNSRINTGETQA